MADAGPERHRAKRSLGQNFLIDPNLQRRIVGALRISPGDEILEIGPGQGALTRHLVGQASRLILVELDDQLARRLQADYADRGTVTVLNRDILTVDPLTMTAHPERLKVIGNIPYNITTPIIFHFLERRPRPAELLLMVQRELADRLLATPGGKTYGALAVGVQSVADVERVLNVGRNAFRPVPEVDSTVVRITPHTPPRLDPEVELALRSLTRTLFGQRRKQLQKTLRDARGLTAPQLERIASVTGLDLRVRPEALSPHELIALAEAVRRMKDEG
jgi:16S rRNA (adenine1518-N6/adenine1519-N6)-dimethyltransferase